jgi:hypothetical protein
MFQPVSLAVLKSATALGAAGKVKKFVAKVVTECAFGINE